jgi:mycoredoxin
MYKSNFCLHSWSIQRFLESNDVDVKYVNIDGDSQARHTLMTLNNGYASVPTLVFSDGTQLTEPSHARLRDKLNIKSPSLTDRIKAVFGH